MIIPVRCFTCGNVLADKYIAYVSTVQDEKNKVSKTIKGLIIFIFILNDL